MHVRGGEVLTPAGIVRADVVVAGGVIEGLGEAHGDALDGTGLLVAPGYIDLQCNGVHEIDLAVEPERISEVSALLPRYGVTSWLPTIVTSPPDIARRAMAAVGGTALGVHLEGPMLAPPRRGAHPEALLRAPSTEVINGWTRDAGVALVTLAPELPGALDVIRTLIDRGVVVAAGHTAATTDEARAAIDAGVTVVTHLWNGMAPMHHRNPGLVGVALADERVTAGLIADGVHLHPVTVAAAWRALGPGRLLLVSDAVSALGLPEAGDAARLGDGTTLAGSTTPLDQAVRNLVAFTGCSPAEAIACVTSTPARLLGLDRKGRIDVGADADMVLLDSDLQVHATLVAGEVVFRA